MQIFANNAERLLILFDDLLTVDEVIRMSKILNNVLLEQNKYMMTIFFR